MTNKGSIQCRPFRECDRIENFSCGDDAIDRWYVNNASESNEISKSYHLVNSDNSVGFFAIYNTSLRRPRFLQFHKLYETYPSEVPVICIGQYALTSAFREDSRAEGTQKIPHEMKYSSQGMFHAMKVCVAAHVMTGGRGIIIHPSNDELIPFYERLGFEKIVSISKKFTMYMPIERARAIVNKEEPSQ